VEHVVYALKVVATLAVFISPFALFLTYADRRHQRIWQQFANESGAVLRERTKGVLGRLGRFWEPGGPRQLEMDLNGTQVTVLYLDGISTTKASTTANGFPRFEVCPVKVVSIRGWGPGKEVPDVSFGDEAFDETYKVRAESGFDVRRLVDENIRAAHRRSPSVAIGTDQEGYLASTIPGWGRDARELHGMFELIELYLEKTST